MPRRSILVTAVSLASLALAVLPANSQEGQKAAEPTGTKDAATKDAGAKPATPSKDDAQIAQWVKQLDDDRFAVRESATEELIKAGQGAVAPLAKAANEAGLEVTVRAIHVLTQLGVADDAATGEAARLALETLAESKSASVRDRADAALEMLDGLEAERALKKVEDLGAYFGAPEYLVAGEALVPLTIKEGKWTGGTDGLRQLRFLREVKMVSVFGKLDDDAVPHLSKLKHLRVLKLYSTRISEKGQAKMKEALPGVQLDVRGGQVGIRGETAAARCQVRDVTPRTAADKAGVQSGDIIVKCDGKPVESFPALVELMRPKPVGTKVKLDILRGDKPVELELTLEAWHEMPSEEPVEPGPRPAPKPEPKP